MDGKEALESVFEDAIYTDGDGKLRDHADLLAARAYAAQLERERDEAVAITKGAIAMSAPLVEQVNKLRAELATLTREEPTK